jgi:hypothetical protein
LLPSQIERLSVFESSRHCPWQVPVCPERIFRLASSWILASAYTPAASQSPPPSNGAWPENIRFDKTIVFPNSLSFAYHYRVALPQQCLYFLPEPQPQGSLRPIFRSAWRYDVLPPPSSCRYPSALRPEIFVNRCHACIDVEDQFFSAFRIDTVLVRTHFWIRIVLVS